MNIRLAILECQRQIFYQSILIFYVPPTAKKIIKTTPVIDAIQILTEQFEQQLAELRAENQQLRLDMASGFSAVRQDMHKDIGLLEWKMITKEYFDQKLFSVNGDLMVLARTNETKATAILYWLKEKKVLQTEVIRSILELEPAAQ